MRPGPGPVGPIEPRPPASPTAASTSTLLGTDVVTEDDIRRMEDLILGA